MPPKSHRKEHDDSKLDAAHAHLEKKNGNGHASTKMRRGASQNSHSQLREVFIAPAVPASPAEPTPPSLNWSTIDRKVLHAYRREHRLNTPTSFTNPYREWILSQPNSIGLYSPTMVRRRQARRQSRDALTLTVRKHFNGMGVQENDVIVDVIYKIRHDPMRVTKGHAITKKE